MTPSELADELEQRAALAAQAANKRGVAGEAQKYGKILLGLVLDNLPGIVAALREKGAERKDMP